MPRIAFSRLSSLPPGHHRKNLQSSVSTAKTMGAVENPRNLTSYIAPPLLHPYHYTAGRWLKDDMLQRKSRQFNFNFAELCNRAIKSCPNARSVATCEKQEGGFNRVFLFTMDNGERIVAKLPSSIAGPRSLTTSSEVATMAYIRFKTTIPLPRVLAWSDDDTNPVGAEYILMEHAAGIQLHGCWNRMNSYDHIQLIKNASMMIKQMTTLEFPAYGSLYFADAPIDPAYKKAIGDGFCIGPHCGTLYWNSAPGESSLYHASSADHGPWSDLRQYCNGLIASASSRIPDGATENLDRVPYHGSVEDNRLLLRDTAAIITDLAKTPVIQSVAQPTLLHPDFHKRNIFVSETDTTKITAIIDWQATSIEPAFIYAIETPDFAARPTTDITAHIVNGNQAHERTAETRATRDMLLCSDAFEVCMKGFVPKIGAARSVDDTLLRPFRHCNTSWRDGVTAGRQHIIELSQKWLELELPGSCPYHPSEQEISAYQAQYEDFELAQALKLGIMHKLGTDSDGWVSAEDWDRIKCAHDNMFREWMGTAIPDMTEGKARYLWPFDPPYDEQDK